MSFKASKSRKKQARQPIAAGSPLVIGSIISNKYYKQLKITISKAMEMTREELKQALESPSMQEFFVQDSSASKIMTVVLEKIRVKFMDIFHKTAKEMAGQFVGQVDQASKNSLMYSLGTLDPGYRNIETGDLNDALAACVNTNVQLITNLGQDQYNRIAQVVNDALLSPDTGRRGMNAIFKSLTEIEGICTRRAKLIATDQTKKIYSAINTQRMEDAGLKKFKWMHSSAGKVPRHSHVERDGKIYLLKGSPSELYDLDGSDANAGVPKGDRGKPGWAINCRCRMVPVLDMEQ